MRKKLFIPLLVFIGKGVFAQMFPPGNANGNPQLNTITTAVPFLMISGNPRQMGLGDVGVVSSNMYHATAFTANAALLANGQRYLSTGTNYTPWLRSLVPDINLTTFSVASAFSKRHAVGFYAKYFDLGNITFTDAQGQPRSVRNPTELVFQLNYATWFPFGLSIGIWTKYVNSNLTDGLITVGGELMGPGEAFAADLGFNFRKHYRKSENVGLGYSLGLGLNNIGTKMSYTQTGGKDFLPMNMMIGLQLNLGLEFDNIRFEHDLSYQVTKLLVPTPPQRGQNLYIDNGLPPGDSIGQIDNPSNIDPAFGEIIAGKDPNVGTFQGIWQSFTDAPGGAREEWDEVVHQVAHEFRFLIDDLFMVAFREGFFYEAATKGNRQYFSIGTGIGVAGFRLDMGGYIPLQQRTPLRNQVYVGLSYRMKLGNGKKLMRFPKWSPQQEDMEDSDALLKEMEGVD